LGNHPGVSGDIGPLGRLAELRYLNLHDTAVAGDVAALAPLGQLRTLKLDSTAVWGRADALRAIPGLGADWSDWTACAAGGSAYRTAADFGQCPAGRSPVADGASYLGADECACCSGSLKMRDPTTGACVDPPGESPPAARNAPIRTHARSTITTRAAPLSRFCSCPDHCHRGHSYRCCRRHPWDPLLPGVSGGGGGGRSDNEALLEEASDEARCDE
jgi:hypothetical protein